LWKRTIQDGQKFLPVFVFSRPYNRIALTKFATSKNPSFHIMAKKISAALISVFDKEGLEPIVRKMHALNIVMYSTGGTQDFIEKLGLPV